MHANLCLSTCWPSALPLAQTSSKENNWHTLVCGTFTCHCMGCTHEACTLVLEVEGRFEAAGWLEVVPHPSNHGGVGVVRARGLSKIQQLASEADHKHKRRVNKAKIFSRRKTGGGGFLFAHENWGGGGKIWWIIPYKAEISSHTPVPLFRSESLCTGSVSWDECEWVFPDELPSEFISLIGSHTVPGQHSQPTPTLSGQGCMCV